MSQLENTSDINLSTEEQGSGDQVNADSKDEDSDNIPSGHDPMIEEEQQDTLEFDDTDSEKDCEDSEDENAHIHDGAEELFRKLSAENRRLQRKINDEELPSTVSLLHGTNGAKIYLIGTAHFSKESCEDVRKVISEAMPDVVLVELCRSRTDLLMNDENKLLELAKDVSFDKIRDHIRHKGLISGLMTLLLLHMSAHITKQLGMAPGGEFRAAYQEFRKIPGCRLHFGDRGVEVTLQRAFATFSFWQKLKFALCVLKDLGPIKPGDIEKLKEKDMLEQALSDMMGEFPEMTNVFLSERDIYLAHSIQKAASQQIVTNTEVLSPVVVAVVGLGHVAGIKERFNEEISDDRISQLMEVPIPSRLSRLLKLVTKVLCIGALGYGVYKICTWSGLCIMGTYNWLSNFILSSKRSITGTGETEL